jgi:hypothetical protein
MLYQQTALTISVSYVHHMSFSRSLHIRRPTYDKPAWLKKSACIRHCSRSSLICETTGAAWCPRAWRWPDCSCQAWRVVGRNLLLVHLHVLHPCAP